MKPNLAGVKSLRDIIRYSIIFGDVLMITHCGLVLNGIQCSFLEFVFGLSVLGFIILYLSTYLLGFCNIIRGMLIHNFTVKCCILYHENFGFGTHIVPIILLLTGVLLLAFLFKNQYRTVGKRMGIFL